MKNLKSFEGDCFDFHKSVIRNKNATKKDPTYKDRVEKLNPDIQKCFAAYEAAFKKNDLESIKAHGYTGQDKEDLQNLYAFQRAPLQTLLNKLTATKNNRKNSICPNCTLSEINSFDHILPQGEYTEFIVNPLNLIPSCTNCNNRKNKYWVTSGKKSFLNLYLDQVPTSQFLYANVVVRAFDDMEITFELKQPSGVPKDTYELVLSHYMKLGLTDRFSGNTDGIVTDLINQIKPSLSRLPRTEIVASAKEYIQSNELVFGKNHWKCVLQKALIYNDDFINLFRYAVV